MPDTEVTTSDPEPTLDDMGREFPGWNRCGPGIKGTSGGPAGTTTGVPPGGRESALVAAEHFLAETVEAVTPDTPAPALLNYAAGYRSHLAALVAASRHPDGREVAPSQAGGRGRP